MKIVIAILIFCIIVIVHELGHFLLAKMNGIAVKEFSIGFGPTLIGYTKNETKYCIRLVPFGGACIFDDEDPDKIEESTFRKASVWARIAVIAAGPIFNFILAFIMALFVVGASGYVATDITSVIEGGPAAAAGLQAGDKILKVGNERVRLFREISLFAYMNQDKPAVITYLRDGEKQQTTLQPEYKEDWGQYYFGISGSVVKGGSPLRVIQYSVYEVRYWISSTLKSIGMIFEGKITKDDVSGPVGITMMVGDIYEEAAPEGVSAIILSMLNIAILISANLGVMNLLPLPALDGGRLMFMFIEVVRRKPISPEKEGMVHFVGLALLMILMVFIMYNDITRLFR